MTIYYFVTPMFAIGHFALGYLTGKATSSTLHTKLNLPLLIVASILPDIDLLLGIANPSFFMHRGPTHSIITFTVVLMPFLLIYGKRPCPITLLPSPIRSSATSLQVALKCFGP